MVLLGVNIDHVATLRNARGTVYPDPVVAARIAEEHGADGITVHLREDRRHIRDDDLNRLKHTVRTRLNLEMANTEEMVAIALSARPTQVTLVPERRQEVTTEGGLDVVRYLDALTHSVERLHSEGIAVSLFIDPDPAQVEASYATGARIVEFHTGRYCEAFEAGGPLRAKDDLQALIAMSTKCVELGIQVNAGHGLNYHNVKPILQLPGLVELNIGHSIVADALFSGLGQAVSRMKELIST